MGEITTVAARRTTFGREQVDAAWVGWWTKFFPGAIRIPRAIGTALAIHRNFAQRCFPASAELRFNVEYFT